MQTADLKMHHEQGMPSTMRVLRRRNKRAMLTDTQGAQPKRDGEESEAERGAGGGGGEGQADSGQLR